MVSRVASIQMTSSTEVSHNLALAEKLIREAAQLGAQLVVLPENFAFMGFAEKDKLRHQEKLGKGPIQNLLMKLSKEYALWIVGGTLPITGSDNKVFASTLVWDSDGECVARYDKIHLFDVRLPEKEQYAESEVTEAGDSIVIVQTPFGKLGLGICYDIRFPELFRNMLKEDVELIALPAAFTYTTGKVHWDILVKARAIENLCYMITSCQSGTHENGRKTFGHSMIVSPWGEAKAILENEVGVIVADIDLEAQKRIRKEFPVLSHRRLHNP